MMDAAAKFPRRASSPPRPLIFSRAPFSPNNVKHRHHNLWIFILAFAAASLTIYFILAPKNINPPSFRIVIDAGSTGTRLHVYGYTISPDAKLPVLDQALTSEMKVRPGLSFYSEDPAIAGASLAELLDFGKGKIPKNRWGDTEIILMATAGLRMLDETIRGSGLEMTGPVLSQAGSEEGVYAWVAANFALGLLGGDPQQTTGIIELGGASAQITFVTGEALPMEFSHIVEFGETTYKLYSNSFLGLGQDVAHESVKKLLSYKAEEAATNWLYADPCSPSGGYSLTLASTAVSFSNSSLEHQPNAFTGGNFSECKSVSRMILQKEKDRCPYQQCRLGSTYVPNLQGRFLATENFFFTSKFFGLGPVPILSDFESAGQQFCEEDWMKLKNRYRTLKEEDFQRYCFSSAYIVALLHDTLGISMTDNRLLFSNEVDNIHLDWALGAFILRTKEAEEQIGWPAAITSHARFFTLLGFVLLSSILSFTVCLILRSQKARVKTVYDLEKGRYIVTKVGR